MKILIDECLPRYLKKGLTGHEVQTVQEAGWSGKKNGDLLMLAEAKFEVFLTADQNLRYQQNLTGRTIAVIELPSNTLSVAKSLVPEIPHTLITIEPGHYMPIKRTMAG